MSDPIDLAAGNGDQPTAAAETLLDVANADAVAAAMRALPDTEKMNVVASTMQSLPDDARPGVAASALQAVPDAATARVVRSAVEALPDPAKADVAAAAMQALPVAAKAHATSAAARTLPDDAWDDLIERLVPDQAMTNDIWKWIVRTFAVTLGGAMVALVAAVFVSFWREIDTSLVQMLLTIFTTTAGILAGFVSGRASTTRPRRV